MSAATLQLPRIAPNWRTPALAVFALLVLLLLSFRDTAVAMVEIWSRSETFTHAYVVPPIVAWLIWRRRAELSTLSPRPAPWMAVPMVLLAALWWLGKLAAANAAMQLALIVHTALPSTTSAANGAGVAAATTIARAASSASAPSTVQGTLPAGPLMSSAAQPAHRLAVPRSRGITSGGVVGPVCGVGGVSGSNGVITPSRRVQQLTTRFLILLYPEQ